MSKIYDRNLRRLSAFSLFSACLVLTLSSCSTITSSPITSSPITSSPNTSSPNTSSPNKSITAQTDMTRTSQSTNEADNNLEQLQTQVPSLAYIELGPTRVLKPAIHKAEILEIFIARFRQSGRVFALISVDRGGEILAWDLKASKAFSLLKLKTIPEVVAFSPDSGYLAYATQISGTLTSVVLVDLRNGSEVIRLDTLKTRIASLGFEPKDKSLVIGGVDGRVYRWKFSAVKQAQSIDEQEKILERYVGHSSAVRAVVYHPSGSVFFTGEWKGAINAWVNYDADLFEGRYDENLFGQRFFSDRAMRVRAGSADGVERLAVSSDGQFIIVALQNGVIEVWQVRGFKKVATVQAHKGLIYDVEVVPGKYSFVSIARDGMLRVWDLKKDIQESKILPDYVIEKKQELSLSQARRLRFLDDKKIIVGTNTGQILEVTLNE